MWDVFISHAWEDKEDVARPLAEALRREGLRVWYDEFTLSVGDSLRRSIDRGLADSRYGVVILSPNFFAKEWPQKELDGLAAREVDGEKVILPVWHNITAARVRKYSPILADRVAVKSEHGLEYIVEELLRTIRPASGQQTPVKQLKRPSHHWLTPSKLWLLALLAVVVLLVNVVFWRPILIKQPSAIATVWASLWATQPMAATPDIPTSMPTSRTSTRAPTATSTIPGVTPAPTSTLLPVTVPPTPTPTDTPVPPSPTPIPTNTPVPPSPTPIPTDTLVPPTPRPKPVIYSFTADRYTITAGESVVLRWDLVGANVAYLRYGGVEEGVVAPGAKTVSPVSTTVYTLVARNDTGETIAQLTITVNPPPTLQPTPQPPGPPPPTDTPVLPTPTLTPTTPPIQILSVYVESSNNLRVVIDGICQRYRLYVRRVGATFGDAPHYEYYQIYESGICLKDLLVVVDVNPSTIYCAEIKSDDGLVRHDISSYLTGSGSKPYIGGMYVDGSCPID